ncbi:MAG: 5-formyltetrahydrofolate cyclo-ligase [Rhodocyclaceae bacterium]|nr:5-formyltetrahydrofolate cyclo-ligase [Rhodocyclaceae bacterium]
MENLTENSTDSTVWRRALRREMVNRRMALTAPTHAEFSDAIVIHLLHHLSQLETQVVAFCWPVKNEPDVRAALAAWRRQGGRAVLPVVVEEDAPLAFRTWEPDTPLVPDRYGIPTPADGEFLVPEAILLPLNAFDAAGYRLGYGGGFFDRTLAALAPRPLAVGVGFEMNRVDSIRPEPHDQRLDWIVTEAGAFRIPGG